MLCYEVSKTICMLPINTLRMTDYSYFHSVMTYGLLFWGNSPDSIKIFRLRKKIIRIMTGCRSADSCKKLFFNLEILPLPSQYILSLLLFMIRNKNQFLVNSEIHHIDTRQNVNYTNLPQTWLNTKRECNYLGVKVFNMLPSYTNTVR